MRRTTVCATTSLLVGVLAVACVSNSNAPAPAPDGSPDRDGGGTDTGTPSEDAGGARDAGSADATIVDATIQDSAAAEDAADAGVTDAAVATDAADAAGLDASPGTVTSSGTLQLTIFRQGHSATLLNDGRVLFCGGYYTETSSLASCDVFTPATTTIAAGPAMSFGRQYQSATVLANGQVLIAGGTGPTLSDGGGYGILQNAEIFDPTANKFTVVSNPLPQALSDQSALLLTAAPNANQVVLLGGTTFDVAADTYSAVATAVLFNPGDASTAGTFTTLGAQMHFARSGAAAALLPSGQPFVTGGLYGGDGGTSGETLDTALSAFTTTANGMSAYRPTAQATPLADGRIFVAGGEGAGATADIYDPTTRSFTTVTLPTPRWYMGLTTLKSGRVLMAGGIGTSGTLGDVVLYDPTTQQFLEASGTLGTPRSIPTATTLQDGRVIIAGGQNAQGMVVPAVDIFTE